MSNVFVLNEKWVKQVELIGELERKLRVQQHLIFKGVADWDEYIAVKREIVYLEKAIDRDYDKLAAIEKYISNAQLMETLQPICIDGKCYKNIIAKDGYLVAIKL